jgi:hypothetical protein
MRGKPGVSLYPRLACDVPEELKGVYGLVLGSVSARSSNFTLPGATATPRPSQWQNVRQLAFLQAPAQDL